MRSSRIRTLIASGMCVVLSGIVMLGPDPVAARRARIQSEASRQWEAVLRLHRLVHGEGLIHIERQIADSSNPPEFRAYLAGRLPVWEEVLHEQSVDVDAAIEVFKVDATTAEELGWRQRVLDELEVRVLLPWIEIARVAPATRREEEP